MFDVALGLGYQLRVNLAGWRPFCEGHCLDPEACWSYLPGLDLVRRAERVAERAAASSGGNSLMAHPTLPSRLTPNSFCASTANSIGSSRNTSLQKPLTLMPTASSVLKPRCRR